MRAPDTKQTYSAADLAAILGVTRGTIYQWARQGRLPPPLRLSSRCFRWPAVDIDHMVAGRKGANRD